jgi:hypothetical protein
LKASRATTRTIKVNDLYLLHVLRKLSAAVGQNHADARADRDDREWLCASAQGGGMARRIPPRANGFPESPYDDQVDSIAQMLDWFNQASSGPSSNPGICYLYKQQYEAQQGAASQTPKLPPLSELLPFSVGVTTRLERDTAWSKDAAAGLSDASQRRSAVWPGLSLRHVRT